MEAHVVNENRSAPAKVRARRVGKVGGHDIWTDAQKDKLRSMWGLDRSIKQIAFDLDKSVSGVKNMRRTLSLPTRKNMNGEYRMKRLGVLLSPAELEGVRRRAFEHRRTPNLYLRMLLKRDGAI